MSRKKPAVLQKQSITSKAAADATGTTIIQKKEAAGSAIAVAPAVVDAALRSSAGKPMDTGTQAFMESRFNYDFSNVKIHTGNLATKSADAINAHAYTSGSNIVFNSEQYDVHTQAGLRLLAHELSHVIQQNSRFNTADKIAREVDEEEKPEYPPDWQHGAPTKPVPPDPNVWTPPKPPDQGPYRQPAPIEEDTTREKIAAALKKAGIPAWAVAGLIVLIIAALADPEPFSKVVLLIGAAAAVLFFIAIGRSSDIPSTATASAEGGEADEEYA